jgi:hypothetical protein
MGVGFRCDDHGYVADGSACRALRCEIPGLTGHVLGTSAHKPRQCQQITINVIPQLLTGSTSRPGWVQQFNPDRGLHATALFTCANPTGRTAQGCSKAARCHERVTTLCKVAAAVFSASFCACSPVVLSLTATGYGVRFELLTLREPGAKQRPLPSHVTGRAVANLRPAGTKG